MQAERQLANNPDYTGQFMQRDIDNNAARWAAVNSIAKTPAELQAAIDARASQAQQLYAAANQTNVVPDATLNYILQRHSVGEALNRASSNDLR